MGESGNRSTSADDDGRDVTLAGEKAAGEGGAGLSIRHQRILH